jgi:hypothetical protein
MRLFVLLLQGCVYFRDESFKAGLSQTAIFNANYSLVLPTQRNEHLSQPIEFLN